jgi:hypothetical protein
MRNIKRVLLALTIVTMGYAGPAQADPITFSAGSGTLSASVTFTIVGDVLTILLTNTATVSPTASNQVLSGVFFAFSGATPTLTAVSAVLPTGSSIVQASECSTNCAGVTNVGGEFSFSSALAAFAPLATYGISSSGYLPSNGSSGNFGGADLDAPSALNGINFGLVNSGFVPYSGNGGMDNDPLIRSSVLFTLTGVAGLTEADILARSVVFTYGTGPENVVGVPEPTSLMFLGLGLLGVAAFARRH